MVREWVRLYSRGRLPTIGELEAAADELLGKAVQEEPSTEAVLEPEPQPRARTESLMEID